MHGIVKGEKYIIIFKHISMILKPQAKFCGIFAIEWLPEFVFLFGQ